MKRFLLFCLFLTPLHTIADEWEQLTSRPANGRFWAASFTAGSKIYTGTGKEDFSDLNPHADMWEFDPSTNVWTQIADYPGGNREGATGFSYGDRGFMGFGSPFIQFTNDLFEYIPSSNSWEAKATCPAKFAHTAGFVIGDNFYIGPENGTNKVYKYSILEDSWSEVAPFPGGDRRAHVTFTANGKGYIGMGAGVFSGVFGDFFRYDPTTDTWTEIASISPNSDQSTAFSIDNTGYVFNVGGSGGGGKAVYKYVESLDEWQFVNTFPGDRIANNTITTLNGKAYLTNGERTNSGGNISSDQIWEFTPSNVGIDHLPETSFTAAAIGNGQIKYAINSSNYLNDFHFEVYDLSGRFILHQPVTSNQGVLSIPHTSGCYIVSMYSNGKRFNSIKIIQ
jgi:N-acetylneuraminic acid mutarotase